MSFFFKRTFNFTREICKFSVILAPPIWTELVTPFLFPIFEGELTTIACHFNGCLIFISLGVAVDYYLAKSRLSKKLTSAQ